MNFLHKSYAVVLLDADSVTGLKALIDSIADSKSSVAVSVFSEFLESAQKLDTAVSLVPIDEIFPPTKVTKGSALAKIKADFANLAERDSFVDIYSIDDTAGIRVNGFREGIELVVSDDDEWDEIPADYRPHRISYAWLLSQLASDLGVLSLNLPRWAFDEGLGHFVLVVNVIFASKDTKSQAPVPELTHIESTRSYLMKRVQRKDGGCEAEYDECEEGESLSEARKSGERRLADRILRRIGGHPATDSVVTRDVVRDIVLEALQG